MQKDDTLFRIAMVLVDGFALLSYATVVEPLRAANLLGERVLYEVCNIPLSGDTARSSGGAIIPGAGAVGGPLDYDLMLVVAGDNCITVHDEPLFNWLRRAARMGIAIGGVSGGPVILAEAGLMTGRRMTAHWEHIPMLGEKSPDLLIERGLYVIDRDRVTCAGGTAPLDLMHALISEHHGPALATRVSDWFIHTDVRPSQGPQRAGIIERWGTTNRKVLEVIMAMEGHIADTLTLDQLASFADMSSRQLNRLFQENLDQTTMAFYRNLRLEKAQNLLKYSTLPVIEIAIATGFASATHFATTHARRFGYPPTAVRKAGAPGPVLS
jgi:AraC family transcriptional regulator, glycine betaine-responsive activator